jgi:hypothetical protein
MQKGAAIVINTAAGGKVRHSCKIRITKDFHCSSSASVLRVSKDGLTAMASRSKCRALVNEQGYKVTKKIHPQEHQER